MSRIFIQLFRYLVKATLILKHIADKKDQTRNYPFWEGFLMESFSKQGGNYVKAQTVLFLLKR